MIPHFPKFSKLQLSHQEEIYTHTLKALPYCDFNFVSLWSYNLKNEIDICTLNGNLVVKFIDCVTNEAFFSFFGNFKIEHTSLDLLQYCKENAINQVLKVIPEVFIKPNYQYSNIKIEEDRHNFDYVYLLEDIKLFPGSKFSKKRNLLNKFMRIHNSHKVSVLNLRDSTTKTHILSLFEKWANLKKKDKIETKNELEALSKLLIHSEKFNLLAVGIYINNILEAFSINEVVHSNYAIGHFAKANFTHVGINEALYKYTAENLIEKKCKYLNLEQDMGIENLRYAKTSWQPCFFLKKYTITLV